MNFDLKRTLYSLPAIILGLTLHEYCHALAAYKLGDATAKSDGRLTFNPLVHIDPVGFIFIVVAGFGWAKPVMFNPNNLKNLRRDKAIIAAAGPISNLLLGIAALYFFKLLIIISLRFAITQTVLRALYVTFSYEVLYIATINLGLFVFNILPIPPLDGSHIFFSGINLSREREAQFMQWGIIILFALIAAERVLDLDIIPIGAFVGKIVSLVLR